MLGGTSRLQIQQVRHASRRSIAYPPYQFDLLNKNSKLRHDSNLKFAMRQFLGPKNFKGEYIYNRYFSAPKDHVPKYITPDLERGQSLRDPISGQVLKYINDKTVIESAGARVSNARGGRIFRPFPQNEHCRTNLALDEETRQEIYEKIQIEKLSTQEVSRQYGLKIPRIEAVVKLVMLEKKLETHVCITKEIQFFVLKSKRHRSYELGF